MIVEYYSSSHKVWVQGVLHLQLIEDPEPRPCYCVAVKKGAQMRVDVPVDAIRPKMCQGEPVELYSRRNNGQWVAGFIVGEQSRGATTLGYRAQIEHSGVDLDHVPAMRLRRRFLKGTAVEVYRGPPHGWRPAVVHSEAEQCEDDDDGMALPSRLHKEKSPGDVKGDNPQLRVWNFVPIFEEDGDMKGRPDQEAAPEWVPAYYLRSRSVHLLSNMVPTDFVV